jgi:ATP-binding cassette subfamily F protein uup
MALITLLNAQLAFGHVPLLDHTDIAIESAERVGLIGRNGAGKSSLLKILGGLEKPDDGTLQVQQGCALPMWRRNPCWTRALRFL